MILCCFDVVANHRLIYINLHVQPETPNSECRKSNQSISAAGGACQVRARTVTADSGGELGEEPEEAGAGSSICSQRYSSGDPGLMGPGTRLQLPNKGPFSSRF